MTVNVAKNPKNIAKLFYPYTLLFNVRSYENINSYYLLDDPAQDYSVESKDGVVVDLD